MDNAAVLTYASFARALASGLQPYLRTRKRRRPPAAEPMVNGRVLCPLCRTAFNPRSVRKARQ